MTGKDTDWSAADPAAGTSSQDHQLTGRIHERLRGRQQRQFLAAAQSPAMLSLRRHGDPAPSRSIVRPAGRGAGPVGAGGAV